MHPKMFIWKYCFSVWLLLLQNGCTVSESDSFDWEQELPLSHGHHWDPYDVHDYKNHPCKRPCKKDGPSKVCHYYFLLEHFATMSAACYGCPGNASECLLPQCVAGDGVPRGILAVNRMVPGPVIDVCEGDTVEVLVDNRMELGEGTSIHWHGLRQRGSQHMDGTSLVTQCPLHTWAKMKYRYEAKDPGTHFWHAHSTMQRCEGLFGGLVIRTPHNLDPQGHLYDHDLPEHYIILNDWTHKTAGSAYAQDFYDGQRTEVRSILVNGLGSAENGPDMPHPVFHVEAGHRYRFRIAYNGIFNCPIYIKVDNHTLLMVASDGQNVEPLEVDAFMIFSGERYDFVLEAKEGVKANFWMRFKGHGRCVGQSVFQTAILRYDGAEDENPEGIATYSNTDEHTDERMLNGRSGHSTNNTFQVVDLRALEPDSQEDHDVLTHKPDKQFYISIGASKLVDERFLPPPNPFSRRTTQNPPPVRPFNHQFNYISSRLPPSPPLSQYYDIPQDLMCNNDTVTEDCTQVQCVCVHMLNFDLGDLVEIVLVSFSATLIHPIHMHGHSYRVVAQNSFDRDITVNEVKAMDKRGEIPRVRSRAPLKDSIGAQDQAVTILRFRADNPGFWFFHCHIEFHAELGMTLILQAGKPEEMPKPPRGFPRCGSFKSEDDDPLSSGKTNESTQGKGFSAEGDDGSDASVSIGLVIGSVLAVVVLAFAVVFIVLRRRRNRIRLFNHVRTLDSETYSLLKS